MHTPLQEKKMNIESHAYANTHSQTLCFTFLQIPFLS